MEIKDISVEEMQARVARYRELRASKQAFVDTRIPAYERDIYNVIGRGVTEGVLTSSLCIYEALK